MNIRDKNNFDALRFLASTLVLFSHSFPLVLDAKSEPLAQLTAGSLNGGKIAVWFFFIVSGFLIAASWESKENLYAFLVARSKRIFPGLALMLVITVGFCAILTKANWTEYGKSAAIYFIKNLTLYKGKFDIAGIFEENPYGAAVNGSLWTLRHEFTCYLMIAALGYFGFIRSAIVWVLWFLCVTLTFTTLITINFFQEFLPLCGWFLAGTLAYIHRDIHLNRMGLVIAIATITLTTLMGLNLLIVSPAISYLLINIAYTPSIFSNFGKNGDFSYGIYIYAFPIQQFVIYLITKSLIGPMAWWVVFLASFPVTLLFAVASWHLVEKRFLKRKVMAA